MPTHRTSLSASELEERMDVYLDPALSSRRTAAKPARDLAGLDRTRQQFVLHWGAVVARDNAELAYQFTAFAPAALGLMDLESVESWLIHAMNLYDKKGQMPAIRALQDVADFAAHRQERLVGMGLEECAGILDRFVCGLNGRPLKIAADAQGFTDTETVFLPPVIGRMPDRDANFRLYKAMTVHLWAQNWYGTWRGGWLLDALEAGRIASTDLGDFHALETARLDACIARDFPGLHRDMTALRDALDASPIGERAIADRLQRPEASVRDSLSLMAEVRWSDVAACPYAGVLRPEAVLARMQRRLQSEREQFRIALARLIDEQDARPVGAKPTETASPGEMPGRFAMRGSEDQEGVDGRRFELLLDCRPVAPPADAIATMESIIQDLGEIPPEYLVAAGPGPYQARPSEDDRNPDSVWAGTYHEEGAFLYDEWDHGRRHHRKDWCVLREQEIEPEDLGFYRETLRRHAGLIKSVRRAFEVLRGDDRRLRRQSDGEDVDIDALVDAHGDARAGLEMTQRLFTRLHRHDRDIVVVFMVDMSGSTKGWINRAEREALILLAEALATLGDRFAIHGFSGWGRKRCEVYPVKRFAEPYDDLAKARICAITPRDYTRMGAPIRHLTRLLLGQDARTRLLITLSDGKPDDYDLQYRGEYGIEDTRQALFEARAAGVHPFCITIDEQGAAYLPHLYGPASYVVISDVATLPLKVSDIYRRLTS